MAESLKLISLHANHWEWAQKGFGRSFAEGGTRKSIRCEPPAFLAKANQTFAPGGAQTLDEAAKKIKAKTLLLYAPGDQVFPAEWIKATETALKANGTSVQSAEIAGPNGHLNGDIHLAPLASKITGFLAQ